MNAASAPCPPRPPTPHGAGPGQQSLRAALLWLLLASLLPLVLVAAAFLWMQWGGQRAAAEAGLRQRAQTLALAVERELGVNVAILETLAAMPQIDARDWAGFHGVAAAAVRARPFSWIVVVDPSGQEVVNTQTAFGAPLPNLLQAYSQQKEVEWRGRRLPAFDVRLLEPARSGRLAVSGLFHGPVARGPVLSAGVPVRRDGKPGYSLLMGFTPDTLALLLARERSASPALTAIVDGNGRVIARNADIARFLGSRALPPFDVPAALPAAGQGKAASLDGRPMVYAYQRLSIADWTVVVAIPRQEMLAPIYRTFIPWLLATLLVMGIGLYLAHRLRRRLVVPLTALADSIDLLRQGRTPAIPATRIREVDSLTRALLEAAQSEAAQREELTRRLASEQQANATAQRLAEDLRESEARFRLMADNIAQLAWMAEADGTIVWYNRRWLDYTGTTGEEMGRDGWRALLHPDHGERVAGKLARCLATGEVWEDCFPLRGADGNYRWFLSRALPVWDPQGPVLRWFGTHTDITRQLEAEAEVRALSADLEQRVRERTASLEEKSRQLEEAATALRVNEARLEAFIENTPAHVFMKDLDGRYILVNRYFAQFFGVRREDVIGKTLADIVASPLVEALRADDRRVLAEGRALELEETVPHPDGERTHFVIKFPLRDADGRIYALCGIATDITERRRAEEEVRAARARFRGILEIAADAIVSVDETQCITLFNRGAEQIFGYPAEMVLGRSLELLIPERYRQMHRDHLAEFAASDDLTRRMDKRAPVFGRRRDGSEFPAEASISRLCLGGKTIFTVMLRDITERRQAEAAIEQLNRTLAQRAAELEAANRELEAFSYSVSHDLRAPLRGIDGFSRLLLENYAAQLDDQGRDCLQRVRASSQRMALLIDDILTLSRLSRADVKREKIDLSALAQAVAEELRASEPHRDVTFAIEAEVSACGDARLLRVVLENLLGNAWKYTAHHPRARIEFGTERRADGTPAYFVRDDGAGFDMAYAGKLFGAFQRLHSQSEFPGTGVGLTSVQRIIHRHGGEIWAESAVEAGATFRFTLPDPPVAP